MTPLPSPAAILAAGTAHSCPPPARPWLGRQSWQHMVLAHWAVPPAQLQALMPAGITLDTWGGSAWVSVVAYRMAHVSLRGMPAACALTFPQLNLRAYGVVDGRPGI